MKKNLWLLMVALLLLLVFAAFNLSLNWFFAGYRLDMTNSKKFTLSEKTAEFISSLPDEVNFRFYISENISKYDLDVLNYANFVSGILARYQQLNPSKIKYEVLKIPAYSNLERAAVKDGMLAVPVENENTYLGINISAANGQSKSIPYLEMQRRSYLENDINNLIFNLFNQKKAIVGLSSPNLPIFNSAKREKIWSILPVLKANFNLIEVPDNLSYIPLDMDVLIVLNPTKVSNLFVYAMDQFLMRGGKLILLMDPYSEIQHFYQGYPPVNKTNLGAFLENFGIGYDSNLAVGDISRAEKVSIKNNGQLQSKSYPLWTYVKNDDFSTLHFRTPGALEVIKKSGIEVQPLILTSKLGGEIAASILRYNPKSRIINSYKQTNKNYVLAAKSSGEFRSVFYQGILDNTKFREDLPPFVPIAVKEDGQLVVIADSDFLSDDLWVSKSDPQNPLYGTVPYAANADFLINTINEMTLKNPLLQYDDLLTSDEKSNIANKIYTKLYDEFTPQLENLEREEMLDLQKLDDIREKAKYADHGELIEYRKQIDFMEKEINENRAQQQFLNYKINKTADDKINIFIFMNLILYPLMIMLILLGGNWLIRTRNLSKWGKMNE